MKKVSLSLVLIAISTFIFAQCSLNLNKGEGGCNSSGTLLSANAWVTLPVNPPSPQNYCISNAVLPSEADITEVRFGAIHNSSVCSGLGGSQGNSIGMPGEYSDFTVSTTPVATFQRGSSHILNIKNAPCNWTGQYLVLAFIDYNQDGDFDDSDEQVYMSSINFMSQLGDIISDTLVTIPMSASLGVTRMRVTNIWNATSSNQGCGTFMCGEVEDYLINIDNETYTYSWFPAAGLSSTTDQYITANPAVTTTYTCTATSSNGSTAVSTINVDPTLYAQVTATNPTCYNSTWTISTIPNGGIAPFTYTWYDQFGVINNTTNTLTGLLPGNYSVVLKDATGCKDSVVSTIVVPTPITANYTSTNVPCYGTNTGSIVVNTTGGTSGYTYTYNGTAAASNVINNLPIGTYTIVVSDANNCTQSTTIDITQPNDFSLFTSGNNNNAQVNVIGGSGTYTYLWMPGNYNTSSVSGLAAGNYTVTVTDENGCSKTQIVTVSNPTATSNVVKSTVVNVFPNPVKNELTITFEPGINAIEIIDMLGKTLITKDNNNNIKAVINIASLSSGLYKVRINKKYISSITKE